MKAITLPMLAAVAIGAITIGSAGAMPFSTNNGAAALNESLVQDVRVVCDRNGRCWNTNRYRSSNYNRGYYDRRPSRGYGYDRRPGVGVTVGPFGFGTY